eukprot:sb/3470401/
MRVILNPDVEWVSQLYGWLALAAFLIGTITNIIALCYFISKKTDIPNVLYTNITLVDLVISLLMLPVATNIIADSAQWSWIANYYFCNAWAIPWSIVNQMSIFLIFTFNVVRTRTLLFPFAKRSKGVVQAVIGCYLAFAIVQVFLPYFFNSSYDFSQDYLVCLWDFGAVFGKDSRQYFLLYGLFNVAERIVPFICVILSAVFPTSY